MEAQTLIARLEEDAFRGTNSKVEYVKKISDKVVTMLRNKTDELQRRAQLQSQLQQAIEAHALHGGSSSVMPEAVMVASRRPTSLSMTPQTSGLVPNQNMLHPCTSNMQIEVEKKHHGQDHYPNFQPMGITRAGPGVQSSPWTMQSGASQSESQYMARQPQATNFVGYSLASGSKPVIRPNSQHNHILGQNDSAIGVRQPQITRLNEILRANQQEMGTQRYQTLGAQQADASNMQPGQLRIQNNQEDARQTGFLHPPFKASEPMTPPVQQIPGAQQSDISAMMRSTTEYDLEEIFCKIKSWKDAYFPQFLELDRRVILPTLTKEQFSSLPEEKANQYKRKADFKKSIRRILNLMSLQKSDVHEGLKVDLPKYEKLINHFLALLERNKTCHAEMNTGYQLQNCDEQRKAINLTGNASPISGGTSREQKQPANASILQPRQTTMARTTTPHQQSNDNYLLGTESASFSSPGSLQSSLQSWSSSMLKSMRPSPHANPIVAPASPCAPVPIISMDVDSITAFLMDDNAAAAPPPKANGSNQVTPTEPIVPASPLQADIAAGHGEVQARGGDGTPVTKRPIDRLMDAIRSSSPGALRSSVNSIRSFLSMSDIVPHGRIGTMLDCKSSLQQQGGSNTVNKMKRVFNHTVSRSESLPLGSMDGSCMSFECGASDSGSSSEVNFKRQKTQNASNEALLEEIKSINNTLIDTVLSISDYCGMDGISLCDGGTTIKLSYSAVSLSPTFKSVFATSEACLVLPVKLFVPADYPSSSPVLRNDERDEVPRNNSSAISASADVAFRHALNALPEPRSIEAMARAWDASVRKAVMWFARQQGGGTISSMFGGWKRCAAA
uniref:ARC105/Med15 mediator subunit C-terminal domain-containing protein n=1 Tax=Triticum urartu TaxID=4572 RepID=A0A8R7TBM0_TRIUA